jgi:hypothetical protein
MQNLFNCDESNFTLGLNFESHLKKFSNTLKISMFFPFFLGSPLNICTLKYKGENSNLEPSNLEQEYKFFTET